jgi:hypothetical protein
VVTTEILAVVNMVAAGAGTTITDITIGGMAYYPNCDWVLNPYTNQWIWTC